LDYSLVATIVTTVLIIASAALGAQSASDKLIKRLSMLLTVKTIKTRHPQSFAIGEYSESTGNIYEVWDAEIQQITALYRRDFKRV